MNKNEVYIKIAFPECKLDQPSIHVSGNII